MIIFNLKELYCTTSLATVANIYHRESKIKLKIENRNPLLLSIIISILNQNK